MTYFDTNLKKWVIRVSIKGEIQEFVGSRLENVRRLAKQAGGAT